MSYSKVTDIIMLLRSRFVMVSAMALVMMCASLCLLSLHADGGMEQFDRWIDLPSDTLLRRGSAFLASGTEADKALICFTIVSNRYRPELSLEEKTACAKAYTGKWLVFLTSYFDYAKSYESLLKARNICDENQLCMPRIDIAFGNLYQTMSEQSDNPDLNIKAFDYYLSGFSTAIQTGDYANADLAFVNMANVAYSLGRFHSVDSCWQVYRRLPCGHSDIRRRYNHKLYTGLAALSAGRWQTAADTFRSQISLLPDDNEYARPMCITYLNIARALAMGGDYGSAIATLSGHESFVVAHGLKDIRLEYLQFKYRYSRSAGDAAMAAACRDAYLHLKDSLLNNSQLSKVEELRFLAQMEEVDSRMAHMEYERQLQVTVSYILVVVVLIVLGFTYVIYRKNSRLSRQNRVLYRKNVEVMRSEEKERDMRKMLERQMADCESAAVATYLTADNVSSDDTAGSGATPGDAAARPKYRDSNLDAADKQRLMQSILAAMENIGEVCSTDFSIDRLAVLTGSKPKYVSQVINECFDCNFNIFLNRYRIREACRRFADVPRYADLTIEAMANDVGFKSRSTFITFFKRITGLTPSEYRWQVQHQ